MDSLEKRLRQRRDQTMASLSDQQRGVLEGGGSLSGHYAQMTVRKLDEGLWDAIFEIAREIDQLKG